MFEMATMSFYPTTRVNKLKFHKCQKLKYNDFIINMVIISKVDTLI